ncbi:MAG: methionyl aminopeptidase [Anaerovoracaceae bacterium]
MKNIDRNDPCWCGSGKKYKKCHLDFDEKIRIIGDKGHMVPPRDIIKNNDQIEMIKKSAAINIAVLDYVGKNIKEGVTTEDIDKWVYEETTRLGGTPATLGYEGYPKSVCTSINNQVCHGIPSPDIILQNGDIINVDCSTILDGYFSDSSRMFIIGDVDPEVKKLVEVTKKSIEIGLSKVKPWGFLGDVGGAINQYAISNGYSVVREIGGHGIGLEFHEEPWVSFVSEPNTEMLMVPGMMFTIEPMINMGTADIYMDEEDGWGVYTADDKASAQWEVQVLVTEDGYEIISY